jgi:hypothetical protein
VPISPREGYKINTKVYKKLIANTHINQIIREVNQEFAKNLLYGITSGGYMALNAVDDAGKVVVNLGDQDRSQMGDLDCSCNGGQIALPRLRRYGEFLRGKILTGLKKGIYFLEYRFDKSEIIVRFFLRDGFAATDIHT